jgi:hypothetical protein
MLLSYVQGRSGTVEKLVSARRLAPRKEISSWTPSFKLLDNFSLHASIAISTAQSLRDANDPSHSVVI